MVNMLLPQEIETFYIIPTLRKHVALALQEQGLKQKDIAQMLGINSSAISQYHSRKRGDKVQFTASILAEIKKSALQIKDQLGYIRETQRLLRFIRISGALCHIHKQMTPIPTHCEPALVDCHLTARGCT